MRAAGEGGKEAKGKGRVAVAVAQRRRCLLQLLLLLLPAVARGWHASLGQRATPVVHATSQRGDLELPRAQDVIHDPCLTVTTTVHKLHLVCNATCATRMPCDWGCQATWNSFLRDVHGIEDTECPGYVGVPGAESAGGLPGPLAQRFDTNFSGVSLIAGPRLPTGLSATSGR